MISFVKSWYQRDTSEFVSNSGSPIETTYELDYAVNGMPYLKEKGKVNIYDMIQSHADSVDINAIVERFAVTGDESLINRVVGQYGDFTNLPTSFGELQRKVLESENIFNSLSVEDRAVFNNSASEFFASLGTERFDDWYNSKLAGQNVPANNTTSEVISNVEE